MPSHVMGVKLETELERSLRKKASPGPGAYEPYLSRSSIGFSIRTKNDESKRKMTMRMLKSIELSRERPGPQDYDAVMSSFDSTSSVSMRMGK